MADSNIDEASSGLQGTARSSQELIKNEPVFVLERELIDYIETMIMIERGSINPTNLGNRLIITDDNPWGAGRLEALDYILHARCVLELQFGTAYLSVAYLDKFLQRISTDDWKLSSYGVRLLSVACLSLGTKMMEERYQRPSLSQFPVRDYPLLTSEIRRMELLVLEKIRWNVNSITPYMYILHFFNKVCPESPPEQTIVGASFIVLAVIKDMNLADQKPSIIAMAAVLVASDNGLTRQGLEMKLKEFPWGPPEIELVFSCYSQMQKIAMGETGGTGAADDMSSGERRFPYDDDSDRNQRHRP